MEVLGTSTPISQASKFATGLNQVERTEAGRFACWEAWGEVPCNPRSGDELPDLPRGDQSEKVRLRGKGKRWPETGLLEVKTQPVCVLTFKSFPRLVLLSLQERKSL